MKRIIKNRVYDTETATFVAAFSPDMYGPWDFEWYKEALYIKKTGEYFLYGKGGPSSPYAKPYGKNGRQGGESITPLTYEEARQWAEDCLPYDAYLKHFEAVGEEDEVSVQAYIKPREKAILDRLRSDGRTISEVISDLLRSSDE